MTTRRHLALFGLLLVTLLQPTDAGAKEVFGFAYLQLEEDPRYEERRAYTGLKLRDRKPPIDGARTAMREVRIMGRSLGLKFELIEETLTQDQDVVEAINGLAERSGTSVFLLDLPLAQVERAAQELAKRDMVLFNIRHRDDALRGAACSPALFHAVPSHAMLMDGLAQYLSKKKWTRALVLEGESDADRILSAAFQASAGKFGLKITGVETLVLSHDPRRRDQTNIPLMTAAEDYDVIFLADTLGEVGRYVPYRSYLPRPVVGTEGLISSPWHWTWERHGAPQLNQRFDRQAKRRMAGDDWAAWAAVKSVVEAIVRTETTELSTLRKFLVSDDFTLDTYKGAPGNFRAWNQQLRQPVLLHTHNAVVARAPIEGFLHETNNLDTLGADERESDCRMAK